MLRIFFIDKKKIQHSTAKFQTKKQKKKNPKNKTLKKHTFPFAFVATQFRSNQPNTPQFPFPISITIIIYSPQTPESSILKIALLSFKIDLPYVLLLLVVRWERWRRRWRRSSRFFRRIRRRTRWRRRWRGGHGWRRWLWGKTSTFWRWKRREGTALWRCT